jgi:hypothetical protein
MAKHTALVTGASAGLGEKFVELFAKEGYDVVLVARNEAKLEEIAKRLAAKYEVTTHVIAADLTDPTAPQQIYDTCQASGLLIDHLVNNAGFGSQGSFLDLDLMREAGMVEVNCTALIKLTHLFAQSMRARGFGRIMNIASTAGFQPGPYMATYYATKAFVLSFTEALAYELRGTGVTVTTHCPGATSTEFAIRAGNDKSNLFKRGSVAGAAEVAEHGFKAMMRGRTLAVHGAMNTFGVVALRVSPRSWIRAIAARFNSVAS